MDGLKPHRMFFAERHRHSGVARIPCYTELGVRDVHAVRSDVGVICVERGYQS
jgi:hypothetical protein